MTQPSGDLSEFLYKMNVWYSNVNEFLNRFTESLNTSAETVKVTMRDPNTGEDKVTNIPAVGAMHARINSLDSQISTIIGVNDDEIELEFMDGSVRRFSMKKMSELVDELEGISTQEFENPTRFGTRNNWFFENMLNPVLYVPIDVSEYTEGNRIDRFEVRKVIMNPRTSADVDFFDDNIRNRSDHDYNTLIDTLSNYGMPYFLDTDTVEMPPAQNRNRGRFSVTDIIDDAVGDDGRLRYELNTVRYKRMSGAQEVDAYLSAGDRVITSDDTEYEVLDVDKDHRLVTMRRVFGIGAVLVGNNNLKIKPDPYVEPMLNVNVGYNERSVMFVRPISRTMNMSTTMMSRGVAVYSNDLLINMADGSEVDLETYYRNFVSDFGIFMSGMAKEKQIPASVGVQPDPPFVVESDFEVVVANSHTRNTQSYRKLNEMLADKEDVASQIRAIDEAINRLQTQLDEGDDTNTRTGIKNQIDEKTNQRNALKTRRSDIISDISNIVGSDPAVIVPPDHRVVGMFPIPDPKQSRYGLQHIIKFVVSYRKVNKAGGSQEAHQINVTETNGSDSVGIFSPWTEIESKIRGKVQKDDGTFEWAPENLGDSDVVNINQISIPIDRGESVQIRVRSVSEAGYPINPRMSEWSNTVTIPFPESLEEGEDTAAMVQKILLENANAQFQDELSTMGLDMHLRDSRAKGDAYFAHIFDVIDSGFRTSEGNIINAYDWAKSVRDKIDAIESALRDDSGEMKVFLESDTGDMTEVSRDDNVITLDAEPYRDVIRLESEPGSVSLDHGAVVTRTWNIVIKNDSVSPLELGVRLAGGVEQPLPALGGEFVESDSDYNSNRRYGEVPIMLSSQYSGGADQSDVGNMPLHQSPQVRSQYINARYRNYGLSAVMYAEAEDHVVGYDYTGKDIGGESVPVNWGHLLPTDPNAGGDTHEDVWNGAGAGDGPLSGFCIHKDHPDVQGVTVADGAELNDFLFPAFESGKKRVPVISHGLYMNLESGASSNVFDVDPMVQCEYTSPDESYTDHKADCYPVKLGFTQNDRYLIGRYTCGAYLYMAPPEYKRVSVKGNSPGMKRTVRHGTSVKIPVVFQYRCTDALGEIGGYRDEPLNNVTYRKKIGIDIYEKLNSSDADARYGDVFSFDIQVSCRYSID